MIFKIKVPFFYRQLSGTNEKLFNRYAWGYIKANKPDLEPITPQNPYQHGYILARYKGDGTPQQREEQAKERAAKKKGRK